MGLIFCERNALTVAKTKRPRRGKPFGDDKSNEKRGPEKSVGIAAQKQLKKPSQQKSIATNIIKMTAAIINQSMFEVP
ncbi:MAG: hypothetical protein IPK79_06055 [Vampirovibrionales bacterium]|nr:hypothetical protein [Vampirovibrionales bacterium]